MSFSQEIRDFLGASQSVMKSFSESNYKGALQKQSEMTTKKIESDMEEDPLDQENKQLRNQALRQRMAIAADNQKLIRAAQQPQESPVAQTIAAPAARAAIPALPPQVTEEPVGTGYANGGLVQKFANGGLVEDDDLEDEYAPPPAIGPTDVSARGRTPMPAARPQEADAVSDALKYGVATLGAPGAVPQPARRARLQAYARGAGAAPVEDMLAIYKKIDPKGEMGESERNLNAINAVYRFKMNSGDAEGAKRTAFSMLQHYRQASQRYAAIAAAAAEGGHVDAAAKAAMKAYANIPDGKDLKIWKSKDGQLNYSMKDESGQEVSSGIASPQQLAAAAMGVATQGFDNYLLQAAGERIANPKGAVGGKAAEGADVPKVKDQSELQDQVASHVDKYVEKAKADPKNKGKEITDDEVSSMKNVMFHIRRNNDVTDDEAFKSAQTFITAPEPKKGEKAPFKVTRDEDGSRTIKFANGRTLELPESDYLPMAAARGAALKEAEDRAKKPKEDSYGDKAGRAMKAGLDLAGEAGAAVKAGGEAIGGAIGRGASAIGDVLENPALASSTRNGLRAIGNPGDNPGVDNPL